MRPVCTTIRCFVLLTLFWGAHTLADEVQTTRPAPNPFYVLENGVKDETYATPEAQAQLVKQLGFAGMSHSGVDGVPERLAALDRHGLKLYAIYVHAHLDPDKPKYDPKLLEVIKHLKGRPTMLWLTIQSDQHKPSSPEGDERAVEIMRELADAARESRIRVALYPHTWFWMERVEDCVRITKKVNRPNVGVTFNLCHWLRNNHPDTLKERLDLAGPFLFQVTINGADTEGDWERLIQPLDRGSFDVSRVLKELKRIGYTGPIGLQCYNIKESKPDHLSRSITAWRQLEKHLDHESCHAKRPHAPAACGALKLIEARKIWDKAPHNAFTDLARFQDRWFCVFREGKAHVSPDGALRVITSADGKTWESAARITSPDSDLRDAKITVTPDQRLMLCGAEAMHDRSKHTHQSLTWFSKNGRDWSDQYEIGDVDFWLWRVTWHKGKAYGIGYGGGRDGWVRLYSSDDGKTFKPLVERLFDVGYPNETSIVFDGDTAYCLLRRDAGPKTGLLGVSKPPYTKWTWKDLGVRIGGPHMLLLPDGRLLAAVRLYDSKTRTSLCWIDPRTGTLTESLKLPSGGDTSYAGLVLHDGLLWVSYYSSHEGKTSIYLAKVKIDK